jgi:pyrimidine deaminase RibD-like protein
MTVRPISSFDGASTADELLSLSTAKLAEIVLQHLKSYEGNHTVMQNGMVHRRYFIGMVEGRNMGLGTPKTIPEYGLKQPVVSEALEEAWNWLVTQGMLMRAIGQPDEWYKITRAGETCLKALNQSKLAQNGSLETSHPASFLPSGGDEYFCRLAVDLARQSILEDDGKPKVGAVVAKDGAVLATAYRGEVLNNHAEYIALELKLSHAILVVASLYITLETCSKRNPPKIPCAERLVQRKVGRLFIGMLDPNPAIQGHGVRLLRDANIQVQFFPHELMTEIEELNRSFTRKFRDAPELTGTSSPVIRAISPDEQKIADLLRFKGKPITVFNKQKYGHGYLEGTFDAVLVDCDSLGVVLKTRENELSFSLSQIEISRDLERKTLKLTVYR